MEFMLMCCFDEKTWAALPVDEKNRIMRDYGALMRNLAERGQLRGGGQGGKLALTDGPFAETKEQLGGYHLLECRDLDEALSIAARIPTLPAGGAIEVRPFESTHENELAAGT